jgi:hypothetical protein
VSYASDVGALGCKLSMDLAALRRRQDERLLSCEAAADMRVALLEGHLAAVRDLRIQHFGETRAEATGKLVEAIEAVGGADDLVDEDQLLRDVGGLG